MKVLNTPIPDSTKEKLDDYSKESGIKKSKIVELALNDYIKRMESKK